MGHCDNGQEAYEEIQKGRRGKQLRDVIANRSDLEVCLLFDSYEAIMRISCEMSGTASQHEACAANARVVSQFFRRPS